MARQIKTKTIVARVDPELHDQLGSEADAQHTTRSELVRRLIIGFLTGITLEQRLEALQKQLASLDSKLAFRDPAAAPPAAPQSLRAQPRRRSRTSSRRQEAGRNRRKEKNDGITTSNCIWRHQ